VHELIEGPEVAALDRYGAPVRTPQGDRPWVTANMVGGLDGSAAVGGRVGALSAGPDARLFLELRALADVVLVGAETVRRERYGAVGFTGEAARWRQAAGKGPPPPIAVVSRSLDLDWSLGAFTDSAVPPLILTCAAADADRLGEARRHGEVIVAGEATVDLAAAMRDLAVLGHEVVLCEGGPTLLGELNGAGLLDELFLSVAPVMGGDPLPVAVTPPGGTLGRFTLRHVLTEDGNLFLRYERERS